MTMWHFISIHANEVLAFFIHRQVCRSLGVPQLNLMDVLLSPVDLLFSASRSLHLCSLHGMLTILTHVAVLFVWINPTHHPSIIG